jgi:hypothetical protein
VANDYLTVDEFKLRSQKQPQDIPKEKELLTALLTAGSRWVDRFCMRNPGEFQTEGDSTAVRYFDGEGRIDLWIDECTSITSVAQTEYPGNSYASMTLNTDYWRSDGAKYDNAPYRLLEVNPNSTRFVYWPHWRRGVKISAVWGYSTTAPEPVKEAVAIIARKFYHLRDGAGESDSAAITDFGMIVPSAIPPKVRAFLAPYKRSPL